MYPPPRKLAWDVIHRVDREKSYADILLDIVLKKPTLKEEDRAFVTELVYGTLRWRGYLDYALSKFSSKPINKVDPEILNILRMGAYQILFLRTPSSAAVDESVKLSKNFNSGKASGFVNAVLRALDREKEKIELPSREDDEIYYLSVKYSHPKWLVNLFAKIFGLPDTEKLLEANNQQASLTLRVNTLKIERDKLAKTMLEEDGIETSPTPYSPDGLIVTSQAIPKNLSVINQGLCIVQDEAAQIVSRVMSPRPGDIVLDLCSAPGGKATHLAALMSNKGIVHAVDINANRLQLVEDNARRLGIKIIQTKRADASAPLKYDRSSFDAVLVDPPCSDLGIIRRHPDVKWIKNTDQLAELSELQLKILNVAGKYVKQGGTLVYAVCTLNPKENEQVIEKFIEANASFKIEPAYEYLPSIKQFCTPEGFVKLAPHISGTDGFFIARLKKNTSPS